MTVVKDKAAADGVPVTLRIEPIDAETYALVIRLHADLLPGTVSFQVPVRAELAGGETVELQHLRVLDRVLPEVAPIPADVQWGVVPAGRTARAEVVLRAMTGTAFEVTGVTVEPAEKTSRFEVHEAGEGKVVVIEASVQDDRRLDATVRIETVDFDARALYAHWRFISRWRPDEGVT